MGESVVLAFPSLTIRDDYALLLLPVNNTCFVVENVMKYSLIDALIIDGGNNFEVRATLYGLIHGFSLGRSRFFDRHRLRGLSCLWSHDLMRVASKDVHMNVPIPMALRCSLEPL